MEINFCALDENICVVDLETGKDDFGFLQRSGIDWFKFHLLFRTT